MNQCFRVFETAASLANVAKFIAQAKTLAADDTADIADVRFAVAFINSWIVDGAFVADSTSFVADAAAVAAATDADAPALVAAMDIGNVVFTEKLEVLTDEGFHLDVIKEGWFNAASGMGPNGWRFSCRDRNDNIQGITFKFLIRFLDF